ncbi:dephospho-CoA kinase [Marinobacter caseinilyticus]|uniref:dephospho-CoA kinase n=1 Tax=Marinobacter caseinilyticus TaxID=2692195 RepID=UPI00140A3633|nr:dephospho-CoA kinase [Marinobacter caseinilyticus]
MTGSSPKVVGLTGGIGSGKSTVAEMFRDLGIHFVDADTVAREVVEPGTVALGDIAGHFGPQILTDDGRLDRAALRTIVFNAPSERVWLETLLHPIIREELARQLQPEHYAEPYVLLVSPLLLETDQHALVDRVVVVDVPVERQIERTAARDNNSPDQVERIIAAQMPREQRLQRADDVIDNQAPRDQVRQQVAALHQRYVSDFS